MNITSDALNMLLNVSKKDVEGLLKEHNIDHIFDDMRFKFYYIRFQNNAPRLGDFIAKLHDHIIGFCLSRDKYNLISPSNAWRMVKEARGKFTAGSGSKSGEPGELILFFLMEGVFQAPKIFSKMSLKTNRNMHIHGSDGVHLGVDGDNITLYFGESKLYSSYSAAIKEAISSVKNFVMQNKEDSSRQEFEIDVLSNHLDIPTGPIREAVLNLIDPYSSEKDNLRYTYTCFIGFDMEYLSKPCNVSDFCLLYEESAKKCCERAYKIISEDDDLMGLNWRFFFMPFPSVDDFRIQFMDRLKQ